MFGFVNVNVAKDEEESLTVHIVITMKLLKRKLWPWILSGSNR